MIDPSKRTLVPSQCMLDRVLSLLIHSRAMRVGHACRESNYACREPNAKNFNLSARPQYLDRGTRPPSAHSRPSPARAALARPSSARAVLAGAVERRFQMNENLRVQSDDKTDRRRLALHSVRAAFEKRRAGMADRVAWDMMIKLASAAEAAEFEGQHAPRGSNHATMGSSQSATPPASAASTAIRAPQALSHAPLLWIPRGPPALKDGSEGLPQQRPKESARGSHGGSTNSPRRSPRQKPSPTMCVADRFYEDIRACDQPTLEQYKTDLQRVGIDATELPAFDYQKCKPAYTTSAQLALHLEQLSAILGGARGGAAARAVSDSLLKQVRPHRPAPPLVRHTKIRTPRTTPRPSTAPATVREKAARAPEAEDDASSALHQRIRYAGELRAKSYGMATPEAKRRLRTMQAMLSYHEQQDKYNEQQDQMSVDLMSWLDLELSELESERPPPTAPITSESVRSFKEIKVAEEERREAMPKTLAVEVAKAAGSAAGLQTDAVPLWHVSPHNLLRPRPDHFLDAHYQLLMGKLAAWNLNCARILNHDTPTPL